MTSSVSRPASAVCRKVARRIPRVDELFALVFKTLIYSQRWIYADSEPMVYLTGNLERSESQALRFCSSVRIWAFRSLSRINTRLLLSLPLVTTLFNYLLSRPRPPSDDFLGVDALTMVCVGIDVHRNANFIHLHAEVLSWHT
jgi:hypothetical protein